MNNAAVCKIIKELECKNLVKTQYSEQCVKEGYGQTCGGYLNQCKKSAVNPIDISQTMHFITYYGTKPDKMPTYQYLRCPQLLLFIAENAGLQKKYLVKGYEIVKKYEDDNKLKFTNKNANYMWGQQAFRNFKLELHVKDLVKIIKESSNWKDVVAQVEQL